MSRTLHRMLALVLLVASSLAVTAAPVLARQTPALEVSDNKRFLVTADGRPFFWLGDTAWELLHRPTREDVTRYLRKRAEQRFTVIQTVALAEIDGLNDPNAYGHRPLANNDPTTPDVKDGPDNDYWDHVDFVIRQAGSLGLYVALLPTWGDKWKVDRGIGPEIFTAQNAEAYGRWLGARYKDTPNIIWVLGGDRAIGTATHLEIIRAMARGLHAGDGGAHLMTFHPPGGNSSSTWFHDDEWLDFNMRQNGHAVEFTGRYDQTRVDYDRTPTKPVLDGEPVYEDHPVSFDARRLGHSIASDVRRPLYWDLFTGGFGHTVRAPLGLADVDAGARAHQQPAPALARGPRPGGRGTDAAWPRADGVAPVPHPHSRPRHHRHRPRGDERTWCRALSVHGDARHERQLRDGVCAGREALQRAHERDHRRQGQGLVVQSPDRRGHRDRQLCQYR